MCIHACLLQPGCKQAVGVLPKEGWQATHLT